MENKLDVLTKKLYDEGVEKARLEAEEIILEARKEADKIIADAQTKAKQLNDQAAEQREVLRRKADSEIAMSMRQSIAALKQSITNLISGKVSKEFSQLGFEEKEFIRELLMKLVDKWDVESGTMDMEILLPAEDKERLEKLIITKYKNILDRGLEVKVSDLKDTFIIRPKDGSYQITFSEMLFDSFFNQYIRGLTRELLFKKEQNSTN